MTTITRPKHRKCKEQAEDFENVLNELLGIGYCQADFNIIKNQKKEFNNFYAKVPPMFSLTQKQVAAGISAETKQFITKILYLLPEATRKVLLKDDRVINEIIDLYSTWFKSNLDISNYNADDRKEILYQTWFVFRLQERQGINRVSVFDKYQNFARAVNRVMADLIPCESENNPKLNVLISDVENMVKPKVYFDIYLTQLKHMFAPVLEIDTIIEITNQIIKYVGEVRELPETQQPFLDKLSATGFTLEQVEIVARYTWGKKAMQRNYFYASIQYMSVALESVKTKAAEFGWEVKQPPNITTDEFEKLVAILFVITDLSFEVELNDFMGLFVPMCYSCLLTDENNNCVFEDDNFAEFINYMRAVFTKWTEASFLPDIYTINPEESQTSDTIDSSTLALPPVEETSTTNVNPTSIKEIEMNTPVNTTASTGEATSSNQALKQGDAQAIPVDSVVKKDPLMESEHSNNNDTARLLFEQSKANAEALETISGQLATLFENQQGLLKRQHSLEEKVLGEENASTLERIREQTKDFVHGVDITESSEFTKTEIVVISVVTASVVASIGYGIYKLFIED
jgi:hypothetical protein